MQPKVREPPAHIQHTRQKPITATPAPVAVLACCPSRRPLADRDTTALPAASPSAPDPPSWQPCAALRPPAHGAAAMLRQRRSPSPTASARGTSRGTGEPGGRTAPTPGVSADSVRPGPPAAQPAPEDHTGSLAIALEPDWNSVGAGRALVGSLRAAVAATPLEMLVGHDPPVLHRPVSAQQRFARFEERIRLRGRESEAIVALLPVNRPWAVGSAARAAGCARSPASGSGSVGVLGRLPGGYDVVYSVFGAVDFADPRLLLLLPAAARALRPGGLFAATTLGHYLGGAPAEVASTTPSTVPQEAAARRATTLATSPRLN